VRQLVPASKSVHWSDHEHQISQLLRDPENSYGTSLLVVSLDRFGPDCLQWHPHTLQLELRDAFGVDLPKANLDKLCAAITVLTTDYFFTSVSRFIDLANILAGDDFDPEVFNPADSFECAWAITEALLLHPPEPEAPEVFAPEIRKYIAHVLRDEGYVQPPSILAIALDEDIADQLRYSSVFTGDPELFSAVYETSAAKNEELEQTVLENLHDLLTQLSRLPLRTGQTQNLIAAVQQQFQQLRQRPPRR
jgi:hypothetical protein